MTQLILLLGAVIVAWLVFTWLVKVIKASVSTAFMVAIVVLVLLAFGIGPQALWQQIINLPTTFQQLFQKDSASPQSLLLLTNQIVD